MADEFDLDALIREMEARGAIPKTFEIGLRHGEPFFKSDPGESVEQTQAGMAAFTELMARRFETAGAASTQPLPSPGDPNCPPHRWWRAACAPQSTTEKRWKCP